MPSRKIIFLSSKNPYSKQEWSGIPFYMFNALSKKYNVEYMAGPRFRLLRKGGYYFSRIFQWAFGMKYVFDYGALLSLLYGCYYSFALWRKSNVRFIFCPAGLTEIAFVKTKIPIVSFGDCSTIQLVDYYPLLHNVSKVSVAEIRWVESKALHKVRLQCFSSSWATTFVSKYYNSKDSPAIPFGANVDQLAAVSPKNIYSTVKLIFIGADWARKGGDDCIEIINALIHIGIDASLTIVGCEPPAHVPPLPQICVISQLDKDSSTGQSQFRLLMEQAHIMILPTRADCTPIVIAEAFSFGMPVIAYNTGGISSMVADGFNGHLVDANNVELFTDVIVKLVSDRERYTKLSSNCLADFNQRFTWTRWADSLTQIIDSKL